MEKSEHQLHDVVCPCEAHSALILSDDGNASCPACGRIYTTDNSIWDLNLGERFDDDRCESMWCNEEKTGHHLVENYLSNLLQQTYPDREPSTIKVLSIGCGVGSDVEALNELGYHAVGIDAGNRCEFWSRRRWSDRYYLANAKYLPFKDGQFDVILMGCVLPHIGVGDDNYETVPGFEKERQLAADEMVRVTKNNGHIIISSPNRLCPVDFFHRANVKNHIPRFHSLKETFLLSKNDYSRILKVGEQCQSIEVMPLRGYWGFYSSSTYLLGRLLQMPVRWYFNHLMSWKWTRFLRSTPLNPWLILKIQR